MNIKKKIIIFLGFGVFDSKLDPSIALSVEDYQIKKQDVIEHPLWKDLDARLSKKNDKFDKGYLETQKFLFLWRESRQRLFTQVILSESDKSGRRAQDFIQKEVYEAQGKSKPNENEKQNLQDTFLDKKYDDFIVKRSFSKPIEFESGEFSNSLVFFGDLFCSDCRKWISTVKKLKTQRSDINVLFRPFFQDNDRWGRMAYEAAYCMESVQPGAFWDFIYSFTNFVDKEKIEKKIFSLAKDLNIDEVKFKECFLARKFKDQVEDQIKYAHSLGVKAPPAVIADGFVFVEHPGDRTINELISDVEFFNSNPTTVSKSKKRSWWEVAVHWIQNLLVGSAQRPPPKN